MINPPDGADKIGLGCVAIILGVGMVFAGFMAGGMLALERGKELRQQAIDHGYAHYHPQTGEWQWIESASDMAEQEASE